MVSRIADQDTLFLWHRATKEGEVGMRLWKPSVLAIAITSLLAAAASANQVSFLNWSSSGDQAFDLAYDSGSNLRTYESGGVTGSVLLTRKPLVKDRYENVTLSLGDYIAGAFVDGAGFASIGAATASSGQVVQPLAGGTIRFTDSSGLLLEMNVTNAKIIRNLQQDNGTVLSGTVMYTGGSIMALFPDYMGNPGSFSFGLDPIYGGDSVTGSYMTSFNAQATGIFAAAVPLPSAAWSGLGLLGLLVAARVRKAMR